MRNLFSYFCFNILLFTGCEKKDVETKIAITGKVDNFTTDKGIGAVTIYFITRYNNKLANQLEINSNTDGSFTFNDAIKHSSTKYTYKFLIESRSGIGNGQEIGFAGVSVMVDVNQLEKFHTFSVVPNHK